MIASTLYNVSFSVCFKMVSMYQQICKEKYILPDLTYKFIE